LFRLVRVNTLYWLTLQVNSGLTIIRLKLDKLFGFCQQDQRQKKKVYKISSGELIASSFIYFSYYSKNLTRNLKNSSVCLICKTNSGQDRFGGVDICLMAAPQIMTLEPHNLTTKRCKEKSCYDFESKLSCGVSLSLENEGIGETNFTSCQNCNTKAQTNSSTIDLMCPRHFTLSSIIERKVTDDKINVYGLSSNCIVCKSDHSLNRELLITMCQPSFTPRPQHELYKFTYMKYPECDQEDESKCEIGVPKKFHDGLYCGSKLGPKPNSSFVRFDYILCEQKNNSPTQVKIFFGW
jgi:hypothetical protein